MDGRQPGLRGETMQLPSAHTGGSGEIKCLLLVRGSDMRDNKKMLLSVVIEGGTVWFNEVDRTNLEEVEIVCDDCWLEKNAK